MPSLMKFYSGTGEATIPPFLIVSVIFIYGSELGSFYLPISSLALRLALHVILLLNTCVYETRSNACRRVKNAYSCTVVKLPTDS